MKNWEEIFLTFEADCKQRNVPRMHILWLRAQCLICIKTDIEFPWGPEKPRNARSNFSAVTAMFGNSQSKKSNFLTWPDLAFSFAHPRDLGTRLARYSFFWPWGVSFEIEILHRRQTSISLMQHMTKKANFDFLDTTFDQSLFFIGFLATAVTIATVMDRPSF